jgi:flagellar hook capping protein FlgD/N,N-dimethylformamidase beta subunit-like protein
VRALSEPSRLAAAVFLLLVVATIGAFFAAQRLKHQDPLLRYRASDRAFSPNDDGIKDTARIRFRLVEADEVTVTILDDDGGTVRRLATNKPLGKGAQMFRWDGQTDEGLLAPEESYRVRVGLRDEGRTNTLPHSIDLDLKPPRPQIAAVDAPGNKPIVIDGLRRRSAVAKVAAPARRPRFSVWRTDMARPREVVERLPSAGKRRAAWDGQIRGRLAAPGTYMITADALDRAGNRGSAPVTLPPPRTGKAEGGVGVVVRPVAIDPPLAPLRPGVVAHVGVDAGGRRYDWSLRRLDGDRVEHGRSATTRLALRLPDGPATAFVLTVRTRAATARAVVPMAAPRSRPVLVVLPALTWQGRNDVDDDGDGLPDSLARERQARIQRPFAGGHLPLGFKRSEAMLLDYLDRQKLRYDLATDLTLARAGGAPLNEHEGVILAGDMRWLPEQLGGRLEAFVRGGGRLFSVGFDSLHRTMALGARTMSSPSERSERDSLGASVSPPVTGTTSLTAQTDAINLFAGTAGSLGTWHSWEVTTDVGRGRLVATAVEDGGDDVFVAYRLGTGIVIRPGVRGWSAALDSAISPPATTTRRIWTLLRR